jgi:oxalate decarboxylase
MSQVPHATYRGGREWRVDATSFPISTTITGTILEIDPGALRELHWHPTADEWQYIIDGQAAVTMFGSHGRFRVETLAKGDAGYIPQGSKRCLANVLLS